MGSSFNSTVVYEWLTFWFKIPNRFGFHESMLSATGHKFGEGRQQPLNTRLRHFDKLSWHQRCKNHNKIINYFGHNINKYRTNCL